ncbi:MAG TPA: glycosyltransferase, partial [Fimbriimonadaceae bacterium]|nr:glycosyltransferase [Fimbriimonadaceae bacterium]
IEEFYGRKVDRVIYPPVHTQNWSEVEHVSDEEGLLYWGRLIDYKRVDLAIDAVRKTGHKLNIVGSGPLDAELRKRASGMSNVVFHGRLPDEELKVLMSRSRAVVFAAYEDFGIVPVEAMAAGLPVIAFGQGGAAETVLPEFGVRFMEQTVESLTGAIEALQGRTFDPTALKAHAAQFDVERFRREYTEEVVRALRARSK